MKYFLVNFFLLIFCTLNFAQNFNEDLLLKYNTSKNVNDKINIGKLLLQEIKYSDPNLTIKISDSLVNISTNNNDIAFFLEIAGASNWHLGNLEKSNQYFKRANNYYLKNNNLEGVATTLNNIAYNYFELGNYSLALKNLTDAYKIEIDLKNDNLLAITNTYLAQVNVRIKNYPNAFNAYQQSINIFLKNKEYKNLSIVYNNIGNIYIEQNNYDSAATWFNKSYKLCNDSNYTKGIAISAANLGLNYLEQKKYSESKKYLLEAFYKFDFLQNTISIVDVSTNLIRLFVEINDLKKATEIAEKIEPQAKNVGSYSQLVNFYKSLSQLYYSTKNFEKAFYYSQQQLVYTDSLANQNTQQLQNEMAAKFQNQLLQDKVDLLTKDNILKDIEIENRNIQKKYYIVIVISVLLILLLLTFIIINKNKTQKVLTQQNKIIKNALEEREILLREIHHRVKNNLQIVSSLLNLQHNYAKTKTPTEILKACESQIQNMALMHEKLYKNDNFKNINLQEYFLNFIENIKQSYVTNIQYKIDVESVQMDIDQLVPFGLILHELIVNSIKHGFANTNISNQIISINAKTLNSKLVVTVFDNGKGLPTDFSFNKYNSLGVRLINGLISQLKGTIEYDLNYKGAFYKIIF